MAISSSVTLVSHNLSMDILLQRKVRHNTWLQKSIKPPRCLAKLKSPIYSPLVSYSSCSHSAHHHSTQPSILTHTLVAWPSSLETPISSNSIHILASCSGTRRFRKASWTCSWRCWWSTLPSGFKKWINCSSLTSSRKRRSWMMTACILPI